MKGGFVEKWLRVDLTSGEITEEVQSEEILRKFGGQLGIGLKIMWDEVPAGVKGKDPKNRLIFSTGALTGTPTLCPTNCMGITRNPGSGNAINWASTHGFWGSYLKFAGYDGIIIQGRAKKPVYLWINDNKCEIRDASQYWGKMDAFEAEDAIKAALSQEIGNDRISVVTIGPAGENLCDSAAAQNDHGHFFGNGSIGTVMGSKNLKAVAVRGTGKVNIADPDLARKTAKAWNEDAMIAPNQAAVVSAIGTVGYVGGVYPIGDLPIKNYATSEWDKVDAIDGPMLRSEKFDHKWKPCYGCAIHHVNWTTIKEGPYKGLTVEEPEYEGVAGLGSNLLIEDPAAVMWLCNENDRFGFDVNWASTVLGWAFEAYEKGLITKEDTDGLELKWGDEKAAGVLLNQLARQEGKVGKAFGLGLKKAVNALCGDAGEAFLVHFKGKANKCHDSRSLWGQFLGLSVSNRGPGWETLGIDLNADPELGSEDRHDPKVKPGTAVRYQDRCLFRETLGICNFGWCDSNLMNDHYNAVTGEEICLEDVYTIGSRLSNLGRAFNVRHGFKPSDDLDIGERFLEAPQNGGAAGKSIRPHIEDMIKEFNKVHDWDWETGRPSKAKLHELGLEDVAEELYG